MLEAIDVLKGVSIACFPNSPTSDRLRQVLGFEETSSKRSPSLSSPTPYSPFTPLSPIHSRSQSSPLPSDLTTRTRSSKVPPITSTTQTKRPRAPSDPFLDTHTPTPPLSTSYSSANTLVQLSISGTTVDGSSCPPTPQAEVPDPFPRLTQGIDLSDSDGSMRTWTSPDLPDADFLSLLKLFPPFVIQNPLPRFPILSTRRPPDVEEGEGSPSVRNEINVGTGNMWLGSKPRTPGWNGNWWTRFTLWLRTLFC